MDAKFEAALASFFDGAKQFGTHSDMPRPPVFELQILRKYARITRDGSAHCFVDLSNGDVLKPASWRGPAKHARGNIHDAHNGLGSMGTYGPGYLL